MSSSSSQQEIQDLKQSILDLQSEIAVKDLQLMNYKNSAIVQLDSLDVTTLNDNEKCTLMALARIASPALGRIYADLDQEFHLVNSTGTYAGLGSSV